MADFRRWVLALAVMALLAAMTVPANAQQTNVPAQAPNGTNLLFPMVTSGANQSTGIAIANGSTQDGTCEINYKGTTNPNPEKVVVKAGATYTTTLPSGTTSFSGYMTARCDFPQAHGFASIASVDNQTPALDYLAVHLE